MTRTDNITVDGDVDGDVDVVKDSSGRLSDTGYIMLGTYVLLIGVGATLGNSATLLMFSRNKKLRNKPHNMLLINLALADLGISVFGYPLTMTSSFSRRWLFGSVGCYVQGYTTFALALGSMYTMTAISVYRYLALCKPELNHRLNKSMTKRVVMVVWTLSLVIPAMPLVGWTDYTLEPYQTACTIDWTSTSADNVAYIVFCIVMCYASTVGTMGFCYYKMARRLRSLHRSIAAARNQVITLSDAESLHKMAGEAKVTWISFIMVITYALIWSPYAWMGLWVSLSGGDAVSGGLLSVPSMLAKSSCLINPVIYIFVSPDFRQSLHACLTRHVQVRHDGRALTTLAITNTANQPENHGRVRNMFKVDRTNDGIYIGNKEITFNHAESTMF